MNPGDYVIVILNNPREQMWGMLKRLDQAGAVIRGIDTCNFEDWCSQIATNRDPDLGVSTVYFPSHRIERLVVDEQIGTVPSMVDRFVQMVGKSPVDVIDF